MLRPDNRAGIAILFGIAGFAIVNGLFGDSKPEPKPDHSKYLTTTPYSPPKAAAAHVPPANAQVAKTDSFFDAPKATSVTHTRPETTFQAPKAEYVPTSYSRTEPSAPLPRYDYSRYTDYTYRPPVGEHYVSGHYRSNGTYVTGHYKTNSDNSFWNDYSSKGNVNPHTGRVGAKSHRTRVIGSKSTFLSARHVTLAALQTSKSLRALVPQGPAPADSPHVFHPDRKTQ